MSIGVRTLTKQIGADVFTRGGTKSIFYEKSGNYLTFNKYLPPKFFPFSTEINATLFALWAKKKQREYDLIFLEGSPNYSLLFKLLDLNKCVHNFAARYWLNHKSMDFYCKKIAPKLKAIIVPSEKFVEILVKRGVSSKKIFVVAPGIDLEEFKPESGVKSNIFKILFASAPTTGNNYVEKFRQKGVFLLLDSFKQFSEEENAELILLWRGLFSKEIAEEVKTRGLDKEVKVLNKNFWSLKRFYSKADISILVPEDIINTPEYPFSLLESLAMGKPIITTDMLGIAKIIREEKCGIVVGRNSADVTLALKTIKKNYLSYSSNCRKTAKKYFSIKRKAKRLQEIFNL